MDEFQLDLLKSLNAIEGIELTADQLSKVIDGSITEYKKSLLTQGRAEVRTKYEKLENKILKTLGYDKDVDGDRDTFLEDVFKNVGNLETISDELKALKKNKDGLPEAEKETFRKEIIKLEKSLETSEESKKSLLIETKLLPHLGTTFNSQESLTNFKNSHQISVDDDGSLKVLRSDGTEYVDGSKNLEIKEIVGGWLDERPYLVKADNPGGGSGLKPNEQGSGNGDSLKIKASDIGTLEEGKLHTFQSVEAMRTAGKVVEILDSV